MRISTATSVDEKIAALVKNLNGRGHARPRKVRTLANTINSLFVQQLGDKELMDLVKTLQQRGLIAVDQDKVSYYLESGE